MRRALAPLVVAALAVAFPAAPAFADGPVFDIGTLSFHGAGVANAPSYAIGTLTFRGAGIPAAPSYDVGTIVFHGDGGAQGPAAYNIGTLRFVGHPKSKAPAKPKAIKPDVPVADESPATIDLSKIFDKPSSAVTNAAPKPAPTQNAPLSNYRLKLLGRTPPMDTNSTLH